MSRDRRNTAILSACQRRRGPVGEAIAFALVLTPLIALLAVRLP